jgi:hypothetical protein
MFLFEFNNLDLEDKRAYIISLPPRGDKGRLLLFRYEGDLKYSLWDCDSFLAEMCALNGKVVKIEGIDLTYKIGSLQNSFRLQLLQYLPIQTSSNWFIMALTISGVVVTKPDSKLRVFALFIPNPAPVRFAEPV